MNDVDIPPLAESVRALVRRAAAMEAAPQGARARVLARVEAIIRPPNGGGGGGHSSGARPVAEPDSNEARQGAFSRMLPLAATFVVGAALGASLMHSTMRRSLSSQPERVVYLERASSATAAATTPVDSAPATPSQTSATPALVPQHPPSTATLNQLAEERALLDPARSALEREDGATALAATEKHEHTFAYGILVQEREAIAIRALVMLDRASEARARADRFRRHFPDSVLLPTIESTIGAAPTR
jgi:hypothetical protein